MSGSGRLMHFASNRSLDPLRRAIVLREPTIKKCSKAVPSYAMPVTVTGIALRRALVWKRAVQPVMWVFELPIIGCKDHEIIN